MKKFATLVLTVVSLFSVASVNNAVSAKSVKRPVKVTRAVKINKESFNADIRINVLKGHKYLGLSERKAMHAFTKGYNLKHLRSYVGKNSNLNYQTATARFNMLVNGYKKSIKSLN